MSVSAGDAAYVRELVHKRAAIALDAAKDYLIESRLQSAASEDGLAGIAELVAKARGGDAPACTRIVEALTTHETSFFRDAAPFEALKQTILPELIASRKAKRTLRIWSAACSSGQEPYSLAMMMATTFPELLDWNVKILATDISERVLAKAREGKFSQLEVNRGLPAPFLIKYFNRVGASWIVKPELRKWIEFKQMNLIGNWVYTPGPDIVLMRNVLIYFDVNTKRQILNRVRQCIAPDGALFLGSAETTFNVSTEWCPVRAAGTTFYKTT